jgi:hypothetical protein
LILILVIYRIPFPVYVRFLVISVLDLVLFFDPLSLIITAVSAAADAAGLGGPGPIAGGRNRIPDVGAARIQELGRWALGKAKESRLAEDGLRFCHVTRG